MGDTPVHWVGHTASPAAVVPLVRLAPAVPGVSAKYGLVALDQPLEPYNDTLNTKRDAEIRQWAQGVLQQLRTKVDIERDHVVFLAGEKYRRHLISEIRHTDIPLLGLSIGRQLQFLKRALAHATPV